MAAADASSCCRSRTTPRPRASTSTSCSAWSTSPASTTCCSSTTSPTPTSASTATTRRRSCRCRARRTSPSSSTRSPSRSRWRGGASGSCSATPRSSPRSAKLKSYLDYGTFQPIQIAATVAMNELPDYPKEANEIYRGRRNTLIDGLSRVGWEIEKPQGTMFVWAPIPEPYEELGSLEFAKMLVREAKVAVSPGRRASVPAARASCASRWSRTSTASTRPSAASSAPSPSSADPVTCDLAWLMRDSHARPRQNGFRGRGRPSCGRGRRRGATRPGVRGRGGAAAGRNAASSRQADAASAGDAHTPSAMPARNAAPSAVVSVLHRSAHGDAEHVGLELAQHVHRAGAAVDPQLGHAGCRRRR